jgi:predicted PurR-regulated permease PerM
VFVPGDGGQFVAVQAGPEARGAGPTSEIGRTWHAGQVEVHVTDVSRGEYPPGQRAPGEIQPKELQPGGRLARLWKAAELRSVPLRTILVSVAVVAATYLAGQLIYRIRDIVLMVLVSGFVAVLLNPIVVAIQRKLVPRRGVAVGIVTGLALLVFLGMAVAFGSPLVTGITHLANQLPNYVRSAENGRGWIGHLVSKYHIQNWVQRNSPKLVSYAQVLSKPALTIGAAALSLVIELVTIFILVLLLLLEAPKMRRALLGQMRPDRAAATTRVAADVNRAVTGYMLGNLLTSLIAGLVVFVSLLVLGVPYPLLWGLWVALVDFLPMIGGALAGIPTVLFAFTHSVTAGIATAVVFLIYTQVENHILNPVIMSKTVRISPLLVLISVLVGASLGSLVDGLFGGFVAALLSIPAAGALQVLVREAWRATAPPAPPGPSAPDIAPEYEHSLVRPGEPFPVSADSREHGS